MDSAELRTMQQPLKDSYREHPEQAVITLRAHGRLEDRAISCSVATGQALTVAGLHPATGGDGSLACSGDMLLQALVACAGVTLRAVAASLGIDVAAGTVSAAGDLDFRGTLAVSKDAPVGFRSIRLRFDLDTEASPEQVQTLVRLHRAVLRGVPDAGPPGSAIRVCRRRVVHAWVFCSDSSGGAPLAGEHPATADAGYWPHG